jgi:N-acetylglucosamine kinase-like BadF-type ATPase
VSEPRVVLAVDGGNSKTDLALVRSDGKVLGLARGPLSSPHRVGLEGSLEVLGALLREALGEAGLQEENGRVADIAELLMAGVDFASEEDELRQAVEHRGWADAVSVGNDTFAILRAGTEQGWGVAVVCGAGINCVGVSPDGRHARFAALGPTTGDWGGGYDVGLAALSAAARSEDGRGPRTALQQAVPAYFGLATPAELGEAIHRGRVPLGRLEELPPLVFGAAGSDLVAGEIVDRLASEVVALARVAVERLQLADQSAEVLLGGGLLRSGDGRLIGAIDAGLREVDPSLIVRRASSPPIVGAALLGLDDLGVRGEAHGRVHEELSAAVARLETDG